MAFEPVDEFIQDPAFSVDATYTPDSGAAKTIKIVFEGQSTDQSIGGDSFEGAAPHAFARTVDVSDATNTGATLQIGILVYKIIGVKPDGTGITDLILSLD